MVIVWVICVALQAAEGLGGDVLANSIILADNVWRKIVVYFVQVVVA